MRYAATFTVAGLIFAPSVAFAHKLIVVPKVAETVRVEVYYEDKTPAEDAKVTIKDEGGTVVSESVTDENGVCVLPRPKPGTYTLIANDGAGHRTRVPLDIPNETATVDPQEAGSVLGNRWVRSAFGVALIGSGALIVRWVRRRR